MSHEQQPGYERIWRYVQQTPWAILPATLAVMTDILRARRAGERLEAEAIRARLGAQHAPASRRAPGGSIAVVPVFGVMIPRADMFSEISGAVSLEKVRAQIRDATRDDDVGTIVLRIDSPGGATDGMPETAAEIRTARGAKRVVAIADTLAASGGYWLASAAEEISISPSGEVGSIGVFAAHEDVSEMLSAAGVKISLISAGKFKTEGNPFEPLGEDARDALQAKVDELYGMFVGDVAKGRGVKAAEVRSGFGEGRTVLARDALRLGMADRIESFEDMTARLAGRKRGRSRRAAAARRRLAFS